MKRIILGLALGLLVLGLSSCPKDPGPNTQIGDFSLDADNITITQGSSGPVTIKIKRTGDFKNLVSLSIANPPTGVTTTFSPIIADGASVITLQVADNAVVKSHPITVTGVGGTKIHTTTFSLTVLKKADNGSFSLTATPVSIEKNSINPAAIVINPKGESTITINRKNGFNKAVLLSVEGLPNGVTPTFTPQNPTGNTSKLELVLENSAPKGSYAITVKGTSGAIKASVVFSLIIKDKPAGSGSFTLTATPVSIQKNSINPNAIVAVPKGESTITITRKDGFDKTIHLTTENLPAGIKATFDPEDAKDNSSKLKLELTGNVAAKTYNITIRGVSGVKTTTTVVVLTVKAQGDKPTIVSISPLNGAKGVKKDAKITIVFSKAMNRQKTQAAFILQGETVSFAWSNGDKTMTITPDHELEYSDDNQYKYYMYTIGHSAEDVAGNTFGGIRRAKFSTYRTLGMTIYSEKALDGFVSSGGHVDTTTPSMWIGDNRSKEHLRGFLSFDLSLLPAKTLRINRASLFLKQFLVTPAPNNPYDVLDWHQDGLDWELMISHVYYGTKLVADDISVDTLGPSRNISLDDKTTAWKIQTITDWVKDDFAKQNQRHSKSQYRLNFPLPSDFNDKAALAMFNTSEYGNDNDVNDLQRRPRLEVGYLAP